MSDDREKIKEWLQDVLDRLDFYTSIVDRFEAKIADLNQHELTVSLRVNEDLTAKVSCFKDSKAVETIVDQVIEFRTAKLDDHAKIKIYDADTVFFMYQRQSELSDLEEVLKDIEKTYHTHIVD